MSVRSNRSGQQRIGRVVAVCLRPERGIPKYPQPEIHLGPSGVEGDAHAGRMRTGRRSGERKANDRSISIVAKEVVTELSMKLGISIPDGGFSENILVEGLGDLSGVDRGDRFVFEGGAVVEVTEQNAPCAKLGLWHKRLPYEASGRRGIVGVVRRTGRIRPGEGVRLRGMEAKRRGPREASGEKDDPGRAY